VFPKKLITGKGGANESGERMTDVGGGNSVRRKVLFLKGKDAQEAGEGSAHHRQAAFAPGPGLGSDEIYHRDTLPVEVAGDTEMEIGGVCEDGQSGFFRTGGGEQFAVLAVDAGDMSDDLEDADDGEGGGVNDGTDAGGAEAGAGATEELGIGEGAAEFLDYEGSVEVAGGFAGGDQEGHGNRLAAWVVFSGQWSVVSFQLSVFSVFGDCTA
jgi:hypothetical protein